MKGRKFRFRGETRDDLTALRTLQDLRERYHSFWRLVVAAQAPPGDELEMAARRVALRELSEEIERVESAYMERALDWLVNSVESKWRVQGHVESLLYEAPKTVYEAHVRSVLWSRRLADAVRAERESRDRWTEELGEEK